MSINIIYEDKYFIAIYKESGIEVDDNLIKLIKKENQKIENLYLVHRIDKFTSGIVLLAKDENTKKYFAEFFYQSVRNSQTDIPVLTCAAARLENGSYRIAIGARPLKAVLFELPAKAGVSAQELAQNFADEVKQKIVTGSNMRGNAEYRRHLAGVLTKRAVLELEARTAQEEN